MLLTTQLDANALLAQLGGTGEELIGIITAQHLLRARIRRRGALGLDGGQDALQTDGKASSRLIASKGRKRGVVAPTTCKRSRHLRRIRLEDEAGVVVEGRDDRKIDDELAISRIGDNQLVGPLELVKPIDAAERLANRTAGLEPPPRRVCVRAGR